MAEDIWQNSQMVLARSRKEAMALLEPDFFSAGVIVVGPEEGSFWALPPLLLSNREIKPLTLVIFEDLKSLQETICCFDCDGFFTTRVVTPLCRLSLDLAIAAILCRSEGPVAVVALKREKKSPFSRQSFGSWLAHEFAHWAIYIWADLQGISPVNIPQLLREGLSEYIEFSLVHGHPYLYPLAPTFLHPIASAWAQQGGGLANVPQGLLYDVGLSLIDFLVRKKQNLWSNLIRELPKWIENWPKCIADWEGEWRKWLLEEEVEPWAKAYSRFLVEEGVFWVKLVEPLFPNLPKIVADIKSDEDVDRLWDVIFGPIPTPDERTLNELRKRECVFHLMSMSERCSSELREILRDSGLP